MAKKKETKSTLTRDFEKAKEILETTGRANNFGTLSGSLLNTGGGLTSTPSLTIEGPIEVATSDSGLNIADYQNMQTMQDNTQQEYITRYDTLLNTPLTDLKNQGFYITTDNGSVFQWADSGHTSSFAYLSIDNIQNIENSRGTAGALLMHFQEPELAKDTAGYSSGSSGTFYQEQGTDPTTQVTSTPIDVVSALPPVVATGTGDDKTVQFDPDVVGTTPTGATPTGATANQQSMLSFGKYWWVWYLVALVVIILYVKYGRK